MMSYGTTAYLTFCIQFPINKSIIADLKTGIIGGHLVVKFDTFGSEWWKAPGNIGDDKL